MASKTIEEYLKTARPEQLAELKKDGHDLQRNGVTVKPEYQTAAPKAAQTRTTEPQISGPVTEHLQKHQRGADKIQQAMSQSQQPNAAEPIQAQEKAPAKEPEQER